jgi:hypothetical protein
VEAAGHRPPGRAAARHHRRVGTDAWGGPTLAGAWAVPAIGAVLVFVLVGLPILTGLAWLQGLLAKRMLGPPARYPG